MNSDIFKVNITNDSISIKLSNSYIINTFNIKYENGWKIKYKNKFLEEFAMLLVEKIENYQLIDNINNALTESDNVKCLIED